MGEVNLSQIPLPVLFLVTIYKEDNRENQLLVLEPKFGLNTYDIGEVVSPGGQG